MDRKTRNKIIILCLSLFILAIGGGIVAAIFSGNSRGLNQSETQETSETTVPEGIETILIPTIEPGADEYGEWEDVVYFDGQAYTYNDNLTTMLFMGIDTYEGIQVNQIMGNQGRADTIMLFILNNEDNTMNILEINRDTYTAVDVYDDNRNLQFTGNMALNMQYTFSDSHTRGCILMKNKIEDILYGVPVDYYCSLTLDGMKNIVAAMGGLEVTFEDDYTDIDESFQSGATVNMTPDQAEHFFRYRDINQLGSNQVRMNRQTWLMSTVFDRMLGSSTDEVATYYEAAGEYLTTDMDLTTIQSIRNYNLQEFYMTPGTYQEGLFHDEFHTDEDQLQQMLIDLFYVEVDS